MSWIVASVRQDSNFNHARPADSLDVDADKIQETTRGTLDMRSLSGKPVAADDA